ncbi:hypothetical protein [Limosilactobacillus fermentum]|uniref:hypothetical protein n=1 Tax=Limosilactobacillus fermentum TaxID=1613 RepID=UPI001E4259A3|nr:hypothetical protein [Limosilactobacillus fermentum]MCD5424109.1 hypothetical protein [Limosilactobacillus fermentum]
METALFLSGLGYLVAIMAFVVAIGFLITLLVGRTSENEVTFKVGKKGTLIAGIALAASLVLGFGAGAVENSIATQRNNRFDNYAEKYTKLYAKTSTDAEDIANNIYDAWKDGIFDNILNNNFDPSTVVSASLEEDADKVYALENNMKELKDTLDSMKDCDAPDRSIKLYQNSYDKMSEMADYVTNPYGNFKSFSDTTNSQDKAVGNYLRKLLNK